MSEKPSNPKDAVGIKKVPTSTISQPVIYELGLAMLEGALKYGRHNYRTIGVRASVYYDATKRHLDAWWEGEDTDPDSGLSHVIKAIASLVVLRDAMMQDTFADDRPPKAKPGWISEMNFKTLALLDKYPNPPMPYRQIDVAWAEAAQEVPPPPGRCHALPLHITNTTDDHTVWCCKKCDVSWRDGDMPKCRINFT